MAGKGKSDKEIAKSVIRKKASKDKDEPETMWQNATPPSPSNSYGSAGSFQIVDTGASMDFITRGPAAKKIMEQRQNSEQYLPDKEVDFVGSTFAGAETESSPSHF